MTIAILGTDADVELAASLRRILEAIPQDRVGQLRIEEQRCAGAESLPGLCRRAQSDLAILIQPGEATSTALAAVVQLRKAWPRCPLLVLLSESLAPEASEFLEAGAADFVLPPIRPWDLLPRVLHLLQPRDGEDELIARLKQVTGPRQIVGQSPILLAQLRKLPPIAACDATVLISGETGTGKELCARAVHYLSRRSGQPFVAVDCGTIPADLIENELFGHERGAYTTALKAQPGLLQESEGGTLFLDEIDALSVATQSKLLRFLQEKEYRPLGSPKSRPADVRVVAASNIALEEAVRAGRFRQDLYYRVNVLSLVMPPLRDRREDIPLLARHFLEKYAVEFSRPARELTAGAVDKLLQYPWPGNARELENIIQRAVLACNSPRIEAQDVEVPVAEPDPAALSYQARKDLMVTKWECDELKRMLTVYRGNVSAVARGEGKDAGAFRALLRKHRLRPTRQTPHWAVTA